MPFLKKFKNLLEIEKGDVESPDYVWLTYAVCACDKDSCGWGGWMIEAAFKTTEDNYPTGSGDKLLNAIDEQVCPKCGKDTFRTGASIRMEPSKNQTNLNGIPGIDYEVAPIEYE